MRLKSFVALIFFICILLTYGFLYPSDQIKKNYVVPSPIVEKYMEVEICSKCKLGSGIYVYRLTTPEFVQSKKMLMIK
jgi:hypothetical protein